MSIYRHCVVLVCAAAITILAQAPTGQINGTVTDPSGAVVAGAEVSATNAATNVRRATTTNEDGLFNLPALPPGIYTLLVDAKGFPKQVREGLELQVGQTAKIDFTLQIGNVSETVQVAAQAPMLQSE